MAASRGGGIWAILLALTIGFTAPAWAADEAAPSGDLLSPPGARLQPPAVMVVEENAAGVVLAIDLPALGLESYEIEGREYHALTLEGGQLVGRPGAPALPAFTRLVAIPPTAGVGLRVLSVEEETLGGIQILPMQAEDGSGFARDDELYRRDTLLGGDPVTVGAPAILRDLRVVPLTVHPVRFNPARGEVRVVRRIEVALDYAGVDLRNVKSRPACPATGLADALYGALVVNYAPGDGRTGPPPDHRGTWLLISRDDAQVTDLLQPLIAWRQRMGFHVVHATTAQTGTSTTSIKAWIQDAYDQWPDPPEYICLVGDVGGAFGLPTFYETVSGYGGEGDHPYVQLDGTDLVPDAWIGRLSAEDLTTLERIVNKIIDYESDPYLTSTAWFTRATLTGDPYDSGPTCVYIQQWLKERLREVGYAQIDTIFTEPFESRTLNSLNQGNTFYGYRGIYGMSGVGSGDIAALQNGPQLTFAVNLTCDTGSWAHGTSRSEAWLRGGVGPNTPTGGIGSIGTATTGTHTRYNNCFYAGTLYGLFWDDRHCIGMAHARGKLEMILNFNEVEPTQATRYCYWNTLIGDPATVMWTGVPEPLTVTYPQVVALGTNLLTVTVTEGGGAPVEGAWVHLYQEGGFSTGGLTDAAGEASLEIDASTAGEVLVTVTGPDLLPHLGSLSIVEADRFVGLHSYTIDDDAVPPSSGNGDGRVNPGETVGLMIALRNYGSQSAPDVVLTATSQDPYLGWVGATTISFGTIDGHQLALAPAPLLVRVDGGCPAGHVARIDLEIVSGADVWPGLLSLPIEGQELIYKDHSLAGVGTLLDPGESGTLVVELENIGVLAAQGPIQAMLGSDGYGVQVTDPYGTFGSIAAGGTGANDADPFGISAPPDCIPGQIVELRMVLTDAAGIRQTVHLAITVGTADSHDPTGPDAYGYYAYDHTDTGYPEAPIYDWIDINPSSGGPGTSVDLDDYGYREDDARTLDLPFAFRFYGEDFDRITVCSNGWLSMDHTYNVNFANYAMPCAFAPPNMIAGFWDDLYQASSGKVYYWNDEANHRFVVSWDNVRRQRGWWQYVNESFQIVLYDPAHYPTQTGDGEILIQFETVNNVDYEGMYATVGIQNEDHTDGLTFNYFDRGPATAADLEDGLAVKFTTRAPGFSGVTSEPTLTGLRLRSGPNPWTAATVVRFDLERAGDLRLQVLDLNGRVVRVLRSGPAGAGPHAVGWRGVDQQGSLLPGGVYLLQLETQGVRRTARTILVR